MKVYLFRHGEIQHDGKTRLIGQTDVPLSETGRNQAQWWRSILEPVAFRHVYCSDLIRSRETAQIIAGNTPASITVLPQLREIALGQWDGLTREEVNERFPGEWDKRGSNIAEYCPVSGESFADLAERVVPALIAVAKSPDRIGHEFDGWRESPERRFDGFASLEAKGTSLHPIRNESDKTLGNQHKTLTHHPEDIMLLVGHAGVNRVILCHVLGMPLHHLFRLRQDYGALNIIDVTEDGWQVSLMNLKPQSYPIPGA